MKSLLALDLPLGPDLEYAVRRCADGYQPFCVLDQRLSRSKRVEQLALLGATELLDASGRVTLEDGRMVDDEVGLVMLTSGSSGTPKAAELTWDALKASAQMTQATLRGERPPTWYPCLPANHIGGLAVVLRAVLDDAKLLWGDAADLDTAVARGATHVAVVRAQLLRHDLSGFSAVLLGGARPPSELATNVVTTWGMTETGSGIVYDGYPLKDVDLASIDGEVCVRSPTLFRSYRNAARPRIMGPDGRDDWFPTGDAGTVTDGRLSVRGRLGFVINSGGEKLWPEDLEAVLMTVEGVRDVAITSIEDPEWGERIVALVVGDGRSLDSAITAAANENIGPWAKPKEIRYVAALPRTSNGKLRRGDLVNLH
ncbi:MAG TPA: AMP-binding protein [Acidimicrobiales bacterium]|nr:AMP-binding protein [Acidimicrobiales bacterium]